MIVIFDIDDCLMPWTESVHAACIKAGLSPEGSTWTQWHMWKDYGCTLEEWLKVVDSLVVEDGIYHAPPYPGVKQAMWKLVEFGHEVHLVTARGFQSHAEEIREWTIDWIDTFHIPGTLWFSQKKSEVAKAIKATHAVDDRYDNFLDLRIEGGVDCYLMNQPHNKSAQVHEHWRVNNIPEFVERILENE